MGEAGKSLSPLTVLLGDSITLNSADGWFDPANAAAGYPLSFLDNAGVGGQKTAAMLARVQTDVVDLDPGVCVVLGGSNDVYGAESASTITTNLAAIYDALDAAGIRIIACTIPPQGNLDAAQQTALTTANTWIRDNYDSWPNALLADFNPAMTIDGLPGWEPDPALFNVDELHPNASGEAAMSSVMEATLGLI